MLASVFQEAGLKTGLYTSPHYADFRERIRISGKMIPESYVVDFIAQYRDRFEDIGLSFFEMTVGMAFRFFADEKVDVAVIETGLGGRLDSTNVITPLVSVITNIGMDHMRFLGNSLREIAGEKAGIIKPGIPVVIGETQEEIRDVFTGRAETMSSAVSFADRHWTIEDAGSNSLKVFRDGNPFIDFNPFPFIGSFQRKNLLTVMETLHQLRDVIPAISPEVVARGISRTVQNTGLKGRWQVIGEKPLVICDSGHNREGIAEVVKNIRNTPHRKLHMVFGMVNDKDAGTILSMLPRNATYYFCRPDIPRGLGAVELAEKANAAGLTGKAFDGVKEALQEAIRRSAENDLVFVGGSTFVVADAIE